MAVATAMAMMTVTAEACWVPQVFVRVVHSSSWEQPQRLPFTPVVAAPNSNSNNFNSNSNGKTFRA
jgi:hypothetical protein